jgi:hypothetical protein
VTVGAAVGFAGVLPGLLVGARGVRDGFLLTGFFDGLLDCLRDGFLLGALTGFFDGLLDGLRDGFLLGALTGFFDGLLDGASQLQKVAPSISLQTQLFWPQH